jgi:membrane protease YdiL (CAAX protease family)
VTTDILPPATIAPSTLPYHRLARARPETSRWWRPLAVTGAAFGIYLAGGFALIILLTVLRLAVPAVFAPTEDLDDPRNPADMLFLLGLVGLMLPAVVLGSRWGGGMRGAIHSVAGRVRWRLVFRTAVVVIPFLTAVQVVAFVAAPPTDFAWPPFDGRLVAVLAIVLVLTPLQCAAEEYAFRALPQQVLGTWLRSPAWGIVLPVPLFVFGHGYDWVGQVDLVVFSLCMGVLVWKTGGVEVSAVVHTGNNLVLFLLAPLSASSLEQGAVPPTALLVSLPLTLLVTVGLVRWLSPTSGSPTSGNRTHAPAPADG